MTIINFISFLDYPLWTQNPLNSVVDLDSSSVIINVTNTQTTFFLSPLRYMREFSGMQI